jgi:DNA (cytosine-5)-methyltransferase 1
MLRWMITVNSSIDNDSKLCHTSLKTMQQSEKSNLMKELTCVDLFSGCGGFGLGAEEAGFRVIAAVDIETSLQSGYRLNFPNTNTILADIAKLESSAWSFVLGRGTPRLDLLIGGPPCQGFSRIGKHSAGDPRNTLIGHYFRHVGMLKPKVFVMENVEGLLDKCNVGFLDAALEELPNYYKVVGPLVVNAAELGAPTNRKRVIVIGYDKREVDEIKIACLRNLESSLKTTVREAISDLPSPHEFDIRKQDFGWAKYPTRAENKLSNYARQARSLPFIEQGWQEALSQLSRGCISGLMGTNHSSAVTDRFSDTLEGKVEPISRYPKLAWSGQCPTLRAGTGPEKGSFQSMRPIHPIQPRVITVREAARLQGFPDWFVFHPTKWHSFRMIGNSVSPMVSKSILAMIKSKIDLRSEARDAVKYTYK